MTKDNYRWIRRMTDERRIRRINPKKPGAFGDFLDKEMFDFLADEPMCVFGVEEEGEAMGAIALAMDEEFIEIVDVRVKETARRVGFGSALLMRAKQYAMEQADGILAAEMDPERMDDEEEMLAFFLENGFYRADRLSEDGIAMLWDAQFSLSQAQREDAVIVENAAANEPMAAVVVPKLMRLREILQEDGKNCELIDGAHPHLWVDENGQDLQISYLARDPRFDFFSLIFSAFLPHEGDVDEIKEAAAAINKNAFFISAYPTEEGIALRYALPEANAPVDDAVFLTAYSEVMAELLAATVG